MNKFKSGVVKMRDDEKLLNDLAKQVEELTLLLGTFIPKHSLLVRSKDLLKQYREAMENDRKKRKSKDID
mgnify:FL=1